MREDEMKEVLRKLRELEEKYNVYLTSVSGGYGSSKVVMVDLDEDKEYDLR